MQEKELVWSWAKILGFSVKRFKTRTWYLPLDPLRRCPKDMIFILPVFLYLSFDPPSFCLSLPYISSLFCLSFASSPESSILSWKAALSLFRYHLHINAARRLDGEHLMRRWQHHQIFAIVYHYFLLDIFPFVTLYDCPGHCSEWSTSEPGTSDQSAEVTIVLGRRPTPC